MEQEKSNKGVIILLIVLVIILAVLCVLFATGTISLNNNQKPNENNQQTSENSQINTDNNPTTSIIQTKLVDNLVCKNSETTFNGITVKLVQSDNDGVCVTSSLLINNKDVKSDVQVWVNSYEIYDNNVIIHSGNTSGMLLTIYNVATNSAVMKLVPNTLNGYWAKSYTTNNSIITVNGQECGDQCGTGTTGYKYATFEIEYSDGTFTTPKLISRSN